MKAVGVAEAKAKLSELLEQVLHKGERIILQRRGRSVAALVPLEDVERVLPQTGADWLDDIVGICADCPEVCDALDQIVADRQSEMPREPAFPWEEQA